MTHPRARRRAAALLAALLAFAAAQLALAVATDAWWPQLRDPLYQDKLERWRRLAGGPAATVAVLGTSRAGMGLDALRLGRLLSGRLGRPAAAVNFGVPACGPVTQALYARRLLADGPRPSLVVFEVLPAMLAGGPHDPPVEAGLFFADRARSDELPALAGYGFPPGEFTGDYAVASAVPAYGRRFTLLTRLSPRLVPWANRNDWSRSSDAGGWSPAVTDDPSPQERVLGAQRAWVEYHDALGRLTFDGPACRAVADALASCRAAGVPAALLLMPEGSVFRGWYPPGADDRLAAWLGGLRSAGTPVIDARRWLGDEAFLDTHHLLRCGAITFTERLAGELAPLVAGARP